MFVPCGFDVSADTVRSPIQYFTGYMYIMSYCFCVLLCSAKQWRVKRLANSHQYNNGEKNIGVTRYISVT